MYDQEEPSELEGLRRVSRGSDSSLDSFEYPLSRDAGGYMTRGKPWWRMFGERGVNRFWWRVIIGALTISGLALVGSLAGVFGSKRKDSAPESRDGCPGYQASNVKLTAHGLTADLALAGDACNTYGYDLKDLKLEVEYQTDTRLMVKVYDAEENVYQVPESILPRPKSATLSSSSSADIQFSVVENPFSFSITRKENHEVLFDTSGSNLVFQSQYLRLRTKLPSNHSLYGLGETSDNLRFNQTGYTRTLWSRDSPDIPPGTNLYGNHPVYFDHRGENGTHGVFLLNSNGMDIYVDDDDDDGVPYLEWNTLGGVFEFYFLAGPTPTDVSKQYADVVGHAASMPYWGFGFHQCRYGYQDWFEVAEVVHNYSQAKIPLETMWTDIDYMDGRKVFTLDPERFPLEKMREFVTSLHDHQQHYVVMVDPAVGYSNYSAFNNGVEKDVFLKRDTGEIYKGVVWPGVTAFPDWFHPNVTDYWNSEFQEFFNADTGVDIDALWIDMNEASNFCIYPCPDPEQFAKDLDFPPAPPPVRNVPVRPLPGFPADFQPPSKQAIKPRQHDTVVAPPMRARDMTERDIEKRTPGDMKGLLDRDLIEPKFKIHNAAGGLSNKTIETGIIHYNGLAEYDTHNMYGTMMSSASRTAMLSRRPGLKPLVITRSTFSGAGRDVGHWLGDNVSTWYQYLVSIRQMLAFAALFQLPMVGSDVCGFNGNTNEHLCARWTTLGAFNPFFRNHNGWGSADQEFYRWELVADAARSAIDRRYKMLDYIYTALQKQSVDGTPILSPLFFMYPSDAATFGIDTQFFYGSSVLVSPVTEADSTSVDIYLPDDLFYDYHTAAPVRGNATTVSLSDIPYTSIPIHVCAGSIIPLRISSANTTTELRKKNFNVLVALDADHKASGSLYLDDGVSLVQEASSDISFTYDAGPFSMDGTFGYDAGVLLETVTFWGMGGEPKRVVSGGKILEWVWHGENGTLVVQAGVGLDKGWSMMVT